MYQQVVVRLCQGETDKEAGSYASIIRPKNIEEAIDKMRWYLHNYQAIFGRNPRREVKQVSPGPHYGGEARVCVIGADRVAEKSLENKMGEVLSAQGKEMSEIKSNLAVLSTQKAAMMEEVKKNRIERYRAQSRSPSPQKGGQTGMLPLWGRGKLQERVPKFGITERGETSVFSGQSGALNSKGATCEA